MIRRLLLRLLRELRLRRVATAPPLSAVPTVTVNLDLWRAVLRSVPLSTTVLLVEKRSGTWCLSDGLHYSREHDEFQAAIDDRTAFRQLTFGEPLLPRVAREEKAA